MPELARSTRRPREAAAGRPPAAQPAGGRRGHDAHVAGDGDCRKVRTVLDRVGEKWSILAIRMLGERPHRFNELRRALDGVTQRMLTLTLRSLERDGLVTRTVTPTIPPRVDYALTPLGRSLWQPIEALTVWALAHHDAIVAARERFSTVRDGAVEHDGLPATS